VKRDILGSYIRSTMGDWEVPDATVAIIKNDKVVYLRAFGVRKQGDAARVDEPTLVFAISSASRTQGLWHFGDPHQILDDAAVNNYLLGMGSSKAPTWVGITQAQEGMVLV